MPVRIPISKLTPEQKAKLNVELLPERDNVQVYKDGFDLLLLVYRSTIGLKRDYRYTLGEEMKLTVQHLLASIYEAKKTTPRAALLSDALHWVYEAKVLYRVMDELKLLRDWQCSAYIHYLATISKQLTAWHKYERRKENEKKTTPADGT
ncbi:MAG: four helix bundle protein [Prevotella sp.]|nr:four helix bundle protein [Prevotella sp.]MBQ3753259.1 four helix bundle protein [Prevotella sp.]